MAYTVSDPSAGKLAAEAAACATLAAGPTARRRPREYG